MSIASQSRRSSSAVMKRAAGEAVYGDVNGIKQPLRFAMQSYRPTACARIDLALQW